jgi:hypothetical protein
MSNVSGDLGITGRSLNIRSLGGRLFSGAAHLTGTMDAQDGPPKYSFDLSVINASPAAIAKVFSEHWGSGLAGFSAHLEMSGLTSHNLMNSATGTLHWNWSKGTLGPSNQPGLGTLPLPRFDGWSGDAVINDGSLNIRHSIMTRGAEFAPVAGSISFGRELDLNGRSGQHLFTVAGILGQPIVKIVPAEQTHFHER